MSTDKSDLDFSKTTVERMYDKLKRLTEQYVDASNKADAFGKLARACENVISALEGDYERDETFVNSLRETAEEAHITARMFEDDAIALSQKMIGLNDRIQGMG